MKENNIAKQIVDAAFQVHQKLGPGLLETVYEMDGIFRIVNGLPE